MKLVEFKNVSKCYGNKKVLDDISFSISGGKIIGLLGRNGTGKSTILKLINDLLTPSLGSVLVKGKSVGVESKKIISYLPERSYLDKSMRVCDCINYFNDFYSDFSCDKAYKLLDDLNIDTKLKLSKMSKGMIEKVSLVLVMSRSADLYILDEPLGGVDPATRDFILDTILTNFKEGSSVIISTHIISDIERILDEVIIIDDGKLLLTGDCDKIRDDNNCSIDELFRRMFKC